ncbi:uncharacterized protein LOC141851281 [Brevipalpus obovatus]|uniref:uncharacterized protein LOC141851281 n=1 Tax=Brevipalpus obovatus TaxID=246614 RepID=UPI003D9ED0A1
MAKNLTKISSIFLINALLLIVRYSECLILRRDDLGFICDVYIESDGDWEKSLNQLQEKLVARDIPLEDIQNNMVNIKSLSQEIVNYNRADEIILNPESEKAEKVYRELASSFGLERLVNGIEESVSENLAHQLIYDFAQDIAHSCKALGFPTSVDVSNPFRVKDLMIQIAMQRNDMVTRFLRSHQND